MRYAYIVLVLTAALSATLPVMTSLGATPAGATTPDAMAPGVVSPTAPAAAVDSVRLANTAAEPDQWLMPGRDQQGSYFSPLADVNAGNVSKLGFAWDYDLHSTRGIEATPLVIDGVMYTTGNFGRVYALDAATGRGLWSYDPQVDGQWGRYACCDAVNRGVVAFGGRLYVGALDGWLHAIDARTGKRIWKVDTLIGRSEHRPYTITGQPLLAGDLVIIGNGGGEFAGARGYISAFDSKTGALRWRFFTVPRDPAQGPQDQPHLTAALKTWDPRHPWNQGSSGNVWDGMAYDPVLKVVYIGTANPGPYNSHLDGRKGGDELYTASIVAIKADSGALAWYYQTVPGDRWDFDSTQKIVQADLTLDGVKRQVLMQASKNGFYYVLDRATGELLSAKNYSYVSWTRGIDPKTGRPIVDQSANYDHGPALVFPSEIGAHTWQPMSFDAGRGLTFIPVVDAGNVELESSGLRAGYIDGQFTTPAFVPEAYDPEGMKSLYGDLPSIEELARSLPAPIDSRTLASPATASSSNATASRGFLRAWDVKQHRIAWEVQTATLFDGGVLSTGGGLVFQGDEAGHLNAYSSDTGKLLASIPLGTSIMAAPMTYRVKGVQYIAVMAGLGGGVMGYPFDPATAAYRYGNEGRIIALRLEGPPPPLPPVVTDQPLPPELPLRPTNAAELAQGEVLYNRYCGRCHLFGRAMLPDLRRLNSATHQIFNQIVLGGAYSPMGMGRFDDVLSAADVDAIHAYLIDQAWQMRQSVPAAASAQGAASLQ